MEFDYKGRIKKNNDYISLLKEEINCRLNCIKEIEMKQNSGKNQNECFTLELQIILHKKEICKLDAEVIYKENYNNKLAEFDKQEK